MKKTVIRRITASVLSLLLLLTPVLSIAVQAQENVETEPYEYKIPTEIINEEAIEENGHIGRVFASEGDMNEICHINDDGTSTMYLFDYPVKYLDSEDGVIKDKSNKLKESKRNNYLYVNDENDIKTYFPKKITKKPVITEVGDYKIEIGIVTDSKYSKKGELLEDNYVFYNQAFGEDTAIGYTVSFNGYKEEIILYSEQAPTSYSFEIYCEGLEVSNRGGILTFAEESTGKTVFTSDPFYIYDSSEEEKSYIETDYSLEKTDDYSYLLTVSLDEEYIASGLTYPVCIDPTLKYETQSTIYDAPIYSNMPYNNFYTASVCYLGYHSDDYGIGRLLIGFTELAYSDLLQSFGEANSNKELISVNLHIYGSPLGTTATGVSVHEFYGADPWYDDTVTWGSVSANSYSQALASLTFSGTSSGFYSLNITPAALHWIGNDMMSYGYVARGLIIKNSNEGETESSRAKMVSTENSALSTCPYLTITYSSKVEEGTYYIKNVATNLFVDIETPSPMIGIPAELKGLSKENRERWYISKGNRGYYTIKNVETNLYLSVNNNSSENNASIVLTASDSAEGAQWSFALSGEKKYIMYARCVDYSNKALNIPSGATSGSNLIQFLYSNDSNYSDEWNLIRMLPTNGYELPYSPEDWSYDRVIAWNNCYSYAINNQIDLREEDITVWNSQQMGQLKGEQYKYSEITTSAVYTAILHDYDVYNELFYASASIYIVSKYDVCPPGTYKVALVFDSPDGDYHWYRQDADGFWSHKMPGNRISNVDALGQYIFDPATAARGNYDTFITYFAVTPWNTYYE